MFAGQAEATRMFRCAQLPAARLDIDYMKAEHARQNPMDLLSDAGMVTLGIRCTKFSLIFCHVPVAHFLSFTRINPDQPNSTKKFCNHIPFLDLAGGLGLHWP